MITLQCAIKIPPKIILPTERKIQMWLSEAMRQAKTPPRRANLDVTIRLVDKSESKKLNKYYRNKNCPTNVLSFSFPQEKQRKQPPKHVITGDLVICLPVLIAEAKDLEKTFTEHFAHLIIHGCLHLLDYDHATLSQAKKMEELEAKIMQKLGFANPYRNMV